MGEIVVPSRYAQVLSPHICGQNRVWKWGLYRCDQSSQDEATLDLGCKLSDRGFIRNRKEEDTETRRGGYVRTEAEAAVLHRQAREGQGLCAAPEGEALRVGSP